MLILGDARANEESVFMVSAGAERLVPVGLGDDQDRAGYDQALDPWLSSLWDAALLLMPLPDGVSIDTSDTLPPPRYLVTPSLSAQAQLQSAQPSNPSANQKKIPSARRPFMARIVKDERLTGDKSEKEVRHFELDLEGSGITYQPGDIVAVQVLPLLSELTPLCYRAATIITGFLLPW